MKRITVISANLFKIAAVELGDPLQWLNIARLNHLSDPMIPGLMTLTIPKASQAYADGIGPQ